MNRRRVKDSFVLIFMFICISTVTGQGRQTRWRCRPRSLNAICHMRTNPSKPEYNIHGTVYFQQRIWGSCRTSRLSVQVKIDGVPLTKDEYLHGLHVHQFGNLSGGCESMGGHYNPFNTPHGGPWDRISARHVGDFGNVRQSEITGRINMRHVDYLAKLRGRHTIIGRGLVLHAEEDDLGRGGDAGSRATGNAGARLACCVIEHSDKQAPPGTYTLY